MRLTYLPTALVLLGTPLASAAKTSFLTQINASTWVFGNDLFNVTQGVGYANKVYYNNKELVGTADGHYFGTDQNSLFVWTNATVVAEGKDYIDISFTHANGDFHWVVYDDLAGAYNYFVNKNIYDTALIRTLWRLDPKIFTHGRTYLKDEPLPDINDILGSPEVQDQTWQTENGTYITKYDWSDFVHERDFYGVYGKDVGSWWIHAGKDYFPGGPLAQTLTVHRDGSATGDAVQLNVFQDTSHFRVGERLALPPGKIWGPWLWYLNDGSIPDVKHQRQLESKKWPYFFLKDTAYQSRGSITGTLQLSDGRPASGATVFIGDTDTSTRPLIQGKDYYYTTTADIRGRFEIEDVRSGSYSLYAWSNGGKLKDIYTNVTQALIVEKKKTTKLGVINWEVPKTKGTIFQVGDFDKKALGFHNGGPPYKHAVSELSPANLTYTVGQSQTSDWYYAQPHIGTWTIQFSLSAKELAQHANSTAILHVSLAGYSQSAALEISTNGNILGYLDKNVIVSDPSVYRSGKVSGEWRFHEYKIAGGVLKVGTNTVDFRITRYTKFRGFLWDSVILDWA